MERFFEKGLTVSKLLEICQEFVAKGYGDAIIGVQDDAEGIYDILINGFEGIGNEFDTGPKVFNLVSVVNKQHFDRIYGNSNSN